VRVKLEVEGIDRITKIAISIQLEEITMDRGKIGGNGFIMRNYLIFLIV